MIYINTGTQRRDVEDREREKQLRSRIELELQMKAASAEHTVDSLTDQLITARVAMAELNNAYESLQLAYREQEKKMCSLKLENASLHEKAEDLDDRLQIAQKAQGW